MNGIRALGVRTATAAVLALAGAVTAPSAAASAADTYSALSLVEYTSTNVARTAALSCDPDAGSIQDPVRACAELAASDGDLDRLPTDRQLLCADYFAPVTAAAVGFLAGRPVSWTHTYANVCYLQRATGSVFLF
jgi:hypothetical protein